MKNLTFSFLILILVSFINACGGGGGGSAPPDDKPDHSANWFLQADVDMSACDGLENYTDQYSFTLNQTDDLLTVITPYGTFSGTASTNDLTWWGQYFDDVLAKWVTITNLSITVDDLSYSGSATLEIRQNETGSIQCQASVTITGNKIQDNAETPVAPRLLPVPDADKGDTSLKITWSDRSINETGFELESSASETEGFAKVADIAANQEAFTDSGLIPNTVYYYRIRAINNAGESGYSSVISVTTNLPEGTVPIAPTVLNVQNTGTTTLSLYWTDNSDNEIGFTVERSLGELTGYAQITDTGVDVISFNDSLIDPSTTYFYRVYAHNSLGNSEFSNVVSVTTLSVIPVDPSDLAASSTATATSVQISWLDNASNETQYIVERSLSPSDGFAEITSLGANATGYTNNDLTPQTTYYYRVVATNSAGNSGYSNTLEITTQAPPLTSPGVPTGFNVVASNTSLAFTLTWNDVANEDNYQVERSTGTTGTFEQISVLGAGAQTYTDTNNLTSDTQYLYRIRATNTAGVSAYTDASGGTSARNADPVTNLQATAAVDASSISLSWTNPDNILSLEVQRSESVNGPYNLVETLAVEQVAYQDLTVVAGTTYYYRVVAINDLASATSTITIATPNVPAAPVNVQAIPGATGLTAQLTWDSAADITNYRVERSTEAAGIYADVSGLLLPDSIDFNDSALTPGTKYFYRVYAMNAVGEIFTQVEMTSPDFPDVPLNFIVVANIHATNAFVAWDDVATETGYELQISTAEAGPYNPADTTIQNATQTSIVLSAANTTYYVRMRAFNAVGFSDYTPVMTIQSARAADSVTVTSVVSQPDATSVDITWIASANASKYRVERSTSAASGFADISGLLGAGFLSFTDSTVSENTAYFYNVYAINSVGESFTQGSITTPALPLPPTGFFVVANLFESTAAVSWNDVANETGYEVQYGTTSSGTLTTRSLSANVTSDILTGLSVSTQYHVRIRSINAVGPSNYTTFQIFTSARPADAVTGLTGASTSTGSAVTLGWTPAVNASRYDIYRRLQGVGGFVLIDSQNNGASGSYTDSSVIKGTTYEYRVNSFNNVGVSAPANIGNVYVKNPPVSPSNLQLSAVAGQTGVDVSLNWTDRSNNELGFHIYYSVYDQDPTLSPRPAATTLLASNGANISTYNVSGFSSIVSGQWVCVRVSAYNNDGEASGPVSCGGPVP